MPPLTTLGKKYSKLILVGSNKSTSICNSEILIELLLLINFGTVLIISPSIKNTFSYKFNFFK